MNPRKHTNHSADLEEELSHLPAEQRLEFIRTWELVGRSESGVKDVPEIDAAWTDLQSRIHASPNPGSPRRDRAARQSSSLRRRSLVAGGVLLAAAAIFLWAWQRPVTAVTPAGELSVTTLADGSTIHLNSGTRLRYRPRTLPGAAHRLRSVELDGEAFFDIRPAEHPFTVETASVLVEVLGTRFNVRARAESGGQTTEVTLSSGRVRVSDRYDDDASVLLTQPGESAYTGPSRGIDSSLVKQAATLDYVLAWRHNAFAAIDRPVAAIIGEIERRYALNIEVDDALNLGDSMTLLYGPGTDAELILHDVCLIQGCRYRPTTRGFALYMPSRDSNK